MNLLFNFFAKFALSLVGKVTIGTCNLASAIAKFAEFPALDKIQFQSNLVQGKFYNLLMAFLMISKNYSNTLMGQLFLVLLQSSYY